MQESAAELLGAGLEHRVGDAIVSGGLRRGGSRAAAVEDLPVHAQRLDAYWQAWVWIAFEAALAQDAWRVLGGG